MPYKKCDCGKECGVRTKVCPACGKSFEKKSPQTDSEKQTKHKKKKAQQSLDPPAIEPGLWVWDTPKNMPRVDPPPTLDKKTKLTNEELQEYIMYEGLGFCIYNYIDPKMIEDKDVAMLWGSAFKIMREIIKKVYDE